MASIIRIKRSSGTSIPSSLNWGELAYVTGIGSYGGINQYKDRIFIGDDGNNVTPVGGYYYTSMMEHSPGTIDGVSNTRNSDRGVVAVLAPATNTSDSSTSLKVDQWNVDNLRLDGNTLSSTNTDGNIILDPTGIGSVIIPDDTFLNFGNALNSRIEYDQAGTDQLTFTGADIRINIPTESNNKDTGALIVEGGVGIEKNLYVGGSINVSGSSIFDSVKIENNVISTLSGSGDTLYLDPYPDGFSNEGTVVIKGNLQVDGTTTAVNSTTVDLNDAIIVLGEVTSVRTVMTTVLAGVSTIRLDSVVGINTGDVISGNAALSLSGVNTVTSYDSVNKIVTLTNTIISPGITTTSQLTVTHAFDTNTDRGIGFNYNTSSGTSNNKIGFFGYIDGTNVGSAATARSWTYIPDATISNSVVTGTRGFLDIRGIYYQTGGYNTHGVVFFDENGLQTSTNAAAAPTITSKQILTAVTEVNLTLPSSVTVSAGDIIKQDVSNAYGVVKVGGTVSTLVLTGVEGTFVNTQNIRKEGNNGSVQNLSLIPSAVTGIHTNMPHWTSTLDGGTF
jgi:hypothetical protein